MNHAIKLEHSDNSGIDSCRWRNSESVLMAYNKAYDHPVYQLARKRLVGRPCHYCGEPGATTVDHVVSLAEGGTHDMGNLVACCARCNSSRGGAVGARRRWAKRNERHSRYQ